ncbi:MULTISPECIES: hypothetical protein [unclassified Nodularia (in: cyanobacteria)]|uniref:hypothetical protein n=1 Tax=unclassified Nodularia (in: cyanobacteria) TaxID=2656917 RepID=UPI00188248C6|nr:MULTISPECIES: hypothetical protein [unclassified Nodularia (in: cyanobacteria)]MBE9197625.1 hypothetical protein [Nodularia sp. LEGE 06071]MCC2692131.1 hypothetical protein [Nodularia sp. LEGE 04288]
MKNHEQKPTNLQQLNCNKMPLFEPLKLEEQDSVVGGQSFTEVILNQAVGLATRFVPPSPNVPANPNLFPQGFGPCGTFICAINLAPSPVEPQ